MVAGENNKKGILYNNEFAFTIYDGRLSTSTRTEIEQNKFFGTVSGFLRIITQRDRVLTTYFDIIIIDENEDGVNYSS